MVARGDHSYPLFRVGLSTCGSLVTPWLLLGRLLENRFDPAPRLNFRGNPCDFYSLTMQKLDHAPSLPGQFPSRLCFYTHDVGHHFGHYLQRGLPLRRYLQFCAANKLPLQLLVFAQQQHNEPGFGHKTVDLLAIFTRSGFDLIPQCIQRLQNAFACDYPLHCSTSWWRPGWTFATLLSRCCSNSFATATSISFSARATRLFVCPHLPRTNSDVRGTISLASSTVRLFRPLLRLCSSLLNILKIMILSNSSDIGRAEVGPFQTESEAAKSVFI